MKRLFISFVVYLIFLSGCAVEEKEPPKTLRLTTTTSVNDSGLLEYLRPYILEEANINLEIVSLGSGAALEAGKRGDADVLLVHSPAAEKNLLKKDMVLSVRHLCTISSSSSDLPVIRPR